MHDPKPQTPGLYLCLCCSPCPPARVSPSFSTLICQTSLCHTYSFNWCWLPLILPLWTLCKLLFYDWHFFSVIVIPSFLIWYLIFISDLHCSSQNRAVIYPVLSCLVQSCPVFVCRVLFPQSIGPWPNFSQIMPDQPVWKSTLLLQNEHTHFVMLTQMGNVKERCQYCVMRWFADILNHCIPLHCVQMNHTLYKKLTTQYVFLFIYFIMGK